MIWRTGGTDLAVHPVLRDIFWNSLVKNHATAYFSGHTHLYARGVKDGLQQVVAGNGGAMGHTLNLSGVDPSLTIEYPVNNADNVGNDVGYLVATVNETAGTMSGVQRVYATDTKTWRTGDQFTLSNSGAVISNTTVPATRG